MTRRTIMVACPACNGEGQVETGGIFVDRETGAASRIMEPCDYCEGTGGAEVELEPVTLEDLTIMDGTAPP